MTFLHVERHECTGLVGWLNHFHTFGRGLGVWLNHPNSFCSCREGAIGLVLLLASVRWVTKGDRDVLLGITERTAITGNSYGAYTVNSPFTEALAENRLINVVTARIMGDTSLVFQGLDFVLVRTW